MKVDAWFVPSVPGLFVNQYVEQVINRKKGTFKPGPKQWGITHRKSGLRLTLPKGMKFNNRQEAIDVMVAIGHMVNWEVDKEDLPLGRELMGIVGDAIDEVRSDGVSAD